MIVGANCATFARMLANASGGETIQLTGASGPIEISKDYNRMIFIDVSQVMVRG